MRKRMRRVGLRALLALVAAAAAIGIAAAPASATWTLNPASYEFGATPVGMYGYPFGFQLTVACKPDGVGGCMASDPLSPILTASGDFKQGNDCPATLPGDTLAGTSCNIFVAFVPTAEGLRTGVLISGSTPGAPSAQLTGTGLPPLPGPKANKCKKKKKHRSDAAKKKKCKKKKPTY
jgi:hypothetical protein